MNIFNNIIQKILKGGKSPELFNDLIIVNFLPNEAQIEVFKQSIEDPDMVDMKQEVSRFKINHIKSKIN